MNIKKRGAIALRCLLILTLFKVSAVQAEDFKWVGQEKQISLFERWIPSATGEKVRELKAVFVVHSDIADIVALLKDAARGARWNAGAAEVKMLKTGTQNQWIGYTRYDIPWPLDDQDCCLKYELNGGMDRMVIDFSSTLNHQFPIRSSVDRITGVKGKWILQKQKDDQIKVVYLITTDRSKKVPRWISDRIVHSNLYDTMASFKTLAEQATSA